MENCEEFEIVEKWQECPTCNGRGWFTDPFGPDPDIITVCDICHHEGKIRLSNDSCRALFTEDTHLIKNVPLYQILV